MKGLKKQMIQIKKVNCDDLVYKYKRNTADAKIDKFDNALDITDKIKNGEICLAEVTNNQEKFKSKLGEIKKGSNKKDQKSKKTRCTMLKCFTKQGAKLLDFTMIIL